jgi:hypothetical protein
LVPQDPADEPAAAMLQRLQAQSVDNTSQAAPRPRGRKPAARSRA